MKMNEDQKAAGAASRARIRAINDAISHRERTRGLSHHDAYLAAQYEEPALFASARDDQANAVNERAGLISAINAP